MGVNPLLNPNSTPPLSHHSTLLGPRQIWWQVGGGGLFSYGPDYWLRLASFHPLPYQDATERQVSERTEGWDAVGVAGSLWAASVTWWVGSKLSESLPSGQIHSKLQNILAARKHKSFCGQIRHSMFIWKQREKYNSTVIHETRLMIFTCLIKK